MEVAGMVGTVKTLEEAMEVMAANVGANAVHDRREAKMGPAETEEKAWSGRVASVERAEGV